MSEYSGSRSRINMHLEASPDASLNEIQAMVVEQGLEFDAIWGGIRKEMENEKIYLVSETELDTHQQQFIQTYFEEEVRSNNIPLMIESIPTLPLSARQVHLPGCRPLAGATAA